MQKHVVGSCSVSCRMLKLAAEASMARPGPSFGEVQEISPSKISFTHGLKRIENWVNHKMDAPSAAIAKVVVVHVLQTCLCTLQASCTIWNSG